MKAESVARPSHAVKPSEVSITELTSVALRLCQIQSDGRFVPQAVGVVSCDAQVGSSTIAMQLALGVAEVSRSQVLLVDGNLRSPRVADEFGLPNAPGLREILRSVGELPDCLHESYCDNLHILPVGTATGSPSLTVNASIWSSTVAQLKEKFDVVIVDLPPLVDAPRSLIMCSPLDNVMLVVEAERTPLEEVRRSIDQLATTNAHLMGIVLNKKRQHIPKWLRKWFDPRSNGFHSNGH